jgi:hypothetical protein
VTITAGASGSGSGTVAYLVAPSLLTSARNGTLTIAGQTVTVTQAAILPAPPPPPPPPPACSYSISPPSTDLAGQATTVSVDVKTQASCDWKATSQASWLHIQGASSGTGSGAITIQVDRYNRKQERTGTVTIADQTFTVTQSRNGGDDQDLTAPEN